VGRLGQARRSVGWREFALSQINYMLGNNSRAFSYMVGFGPNYPLQPHHAGR